MMDRVLDETATVREGEELPVEALERYLLAHVPQARGRLEVRQFPGGNSNLTYLLRFGEFEMVMRRPPFGNRVKSAHDMGREYRVLSKLSAVYPPAPRPYHYCEDETVIGAPFYVMERRTGLILRRDVPASVVIDSPTARRLSESFIDNLAVLHTLDYEAAGLGDLGRPQGYAERQVKGWIKRWKNVELGTHPDIDALLAWLEAHIPPEAAAGIVHNDYKYDNVILDPDNVTRIRTVLDWEMCTLGDPTMDLATTLSYWTQANDPEDIKEARRSPTSLPGSFTRRELAERYAAKTGFDLSNLFYNYVFALFKLAVILQQIYFRYHEGHTKDERFARKGDDALVLARLAIRALESGSV